MTSRFVSNVLVLIAGVMLVAFSLVFGSRVLGWVGLGLGCLVVVIVLAAFPVRGRGVPQRIVDALVLVGAGWLIVATRSFSGPPLKWICFGTGATLALLALVGLVAHEVSMELAVRPVLREPGDGWVRTSMREQAPAG